MYSLPSVCVSFGIRTVCVERYDALSAHSKFVSHRYRRMLAIFIYVLLGNTIQICKKEKLFNSTEWQIISLPQFYSRLRRRLYCVIYCCCKILHFRSAVFETLRSCYPLIAIPTRLRISKAHEKHNMLSNIRVVLCSLVTFWPIYWDISFYATELDKV